MKRSEASDILGAMPLEELEDRCSSARRNTFGEKVDLCAIINARNGACTEDCAFCAQSRTAGSKMLDLYELNEAHRSATDAGIERFSAVTSGRDLSGNEFRRICDMAATGSGLCPLCASLGILDLPRLEELKRAGIARYHHNLESSENFFPQLCTTHSWQDRAMTVARARTAGLSVCSGGIIGIGESDDDRIELAFSLRELEVESIALNFFVPVSGARVSSENLSTEKLLRIIGLFRLVNPKAEVRICAGRARLEDHNGRIFSFGATGIMTGTLLTTAGSALNNDMELIDRSGYSL